MTVVVIGESLFDIVVRDGVEIGATPGGSPMNVAVGLARLGHDVHLATQFGDDAYGSAIAGYLAKEALVYTNEVTDQTSRATATLTDNGAADYDFDITWDLQLQTPGICAALETAGLVHTGSLGAHHQPGSTQVFREVAARSGSAVVSYDPNCRPSILPDRARFRKEVEEFIRISDVVKASEEDLAWLYPDAELADVMAAWVKGGPGLVVVTCGGKPALAARTPKEIREVATVPVGVEDTIGAGDSFMAALLSGLVKAGVSGPHGRETLDSLSMADVDEVLRVAAIAASITCSRRGANPPNSDELQAALREGSGW